MAKFQLTKATKEQAKARIAFIGPSGSGKTFSALSVAQHLGSRVAVIDTENHSASKYADVFNFETLSLAEYSPQTFTEAIRFCEAQKVDVIIVDSLSHAWMGKGGALEQVDQASKRYNNNSFMAWRDVTPHHNTLVDTLAHCPCHLIVTMRSKMEYVIDKDEKTGKAVPRKLGLAPIQRDGLEYEFDIVGDIDLNHNWIISKTRCQALDGKVINRPGEEIAQTILQWLTSGEPVKGINSTAAATGAKNTASTAPPAGGKTTKPATVPTGKKLSREDVVSLYSLVDASGATTEIFNCIFDREVPNRRLDTGKINWNAVEIPEFERLKLLFKTPERWQKVYREIMEFEELAEGINLDDIADVPGEQQAG